MSVYRLVVKFLDHKFEVLREHLDPNTNKVYSQTIYSSDFNPKLPHSHMGYMMKSVAKVLNQMGMDLKKEETKSLIVRDVFELYRKDLNSNSVSKNLEFVHKLIPESVIFDTTYERWNALDLDTKKEILKRLHDFHDEINTKFHNANTTRSSISPSKKNPSPSTFPSQPPSEKVSPPTLKEAKELVEDAASRSVDSTHFRKAIMGILAALAAAGVANYWPQLRQQIIKLKKVASEKRPTPKTSSLRPSSSRRKKNTKRKSK